jgi:hypothetical protein
MGNLFSSCKKYSKLDENDKENFLLYDNFNDKIEDNKQRINNVEESVVSVNKTVSNVVTNYNREFTNLNTDLLNLKKDIETFKKNFKTQEVLELEREKKINWIENKLLSSESQDEFLSTLQTEQETDPLQL